MSQNLKSWTHRSPYFIRTEFTQVVLDAKHNDLKTTCGRYHPGQQATQADVPNKLPTQTVCSYAQRKNTGFYRQSGLWTFHMRILKDAVSFQATWGAYLQSIHALGEEFAGSAKSGLLTMWKLPGRCRTPKVLIKSGGSVGALMTANTLKFRTLFCCLSAQQELALWMQQVNCKPPLASSQLQQAPRAQSRMERKCCFAIDKSWFWLYDICHIW